MLTVYSFPIASVLQAWDIETSEFACFVIH